MLQVATGVDLLEGAIRFRLVHQMLQNDRSSLLRSNVSSGSGQVERLLWASKIKSIKSKLLIQMGQNRRTFRITRAVVMALHLKSAGPATQVYAIVG